MPRPHPRQLAVVAAVLCLAPVWLRGQPPPDGTWAADAEIVDPQRVTLPGLGAAQGVTVRDGKLYVYGDVYDANPRVGVIREYTADFRPTGRVVWLRTAKGPLLRHPTGLTAHPKWGTFLGDTVNQKAVIYRLDWDKAWADGDLTRAVLDTVADDAAVNGCRPEFVTVDGVDYLATADYGDVRPEVRLLDPAKMLAAGRTSSPGVVVHRVQCGPFNQNLHWDAAAGELTCVQNVIAGRGWRLDVLDLKKAVADGRASGPGVRARTLTFPPHDELEGYRPLGDGRGLFVTSNERDNVTVGRAKSVPPRATGPGK